MNADDFNVERLKLNGGREASIVSHKMWDAAEGLEFAQQLYGQNGHVVSFPEITQIMIDNPNNSSLWNECNLTTTTEVLASLPYSFVFHNIGLVTPTEMRGQQGDHDYPIPQINTMKLGSGGLDQLRSFSDKTISLEELNRNPPHVRESYGVILPHNSVNFAFNYLNIAQATKLPVYQAIVGGKDRLVALLDKVDKNWSNSNTEVTLVKSRLSGELGSSMLVSRSGPACYGNGYNSEAIEAGFLNAYGSQFLALKD